MKKIILFLVMAVALTTSTLFAQVPSYVPTNGLVGYWPFSGNANDISGNDNNGTNNGATLITDRFGNTNSAYSFDGINDFIQAPNYASNSSFTVSCWVNMSTYNLNSLGSNDFIFFANHSGTNNSSRNFMLGYRNFGNENGFSSYIFNSTGAQLGGYATNQTPPSVNSWHHLVSVFENGTYIKMYLDGVLFYNQTSNVPTQSNMPSLPLFFGIGVATQFDFLEGKLDDVGFWNRALTETEITNLYNSSLPQTACLPANIPTTGLVGYWPFCGNANDESGNANNGTVNGATLTTDRFGNANSAYSFDGVDDKIHIGQLNLTSNYSISFWSNLNNSQFQYPIGFGVNQTNTVDLFKGYGIGYSSTLPQCSGLTNSKYFVFDAVSTCNNFIECNNIINPSQWSHVVMSKNGNLVSIYINGTLENSGTNLNLQGIIDLYFGVRTDLFAYFNGILDDIGIWNRALTQEEITNLYNVNQCITNITVTDTLIINVGQLSFNDPVAWANSITIAPNPASSQININFNNITNLNGGTLKIINSLGQEVATTPITTSGTNSTMQLATWGGTGMYFVQIINPQGQIVDIKKIILQ
ncbi:MAG: LamG-like jellyroll fold domain-containing protein [Flavobacterium sp.]|uniref:LamG-like jellyroll fold domain-containing protein n=1 Tax=Flavobacterium sp. TaxID=239 RepID=UPI003BD8B64D